MKQAPTIKIPICLMALVVFLAVPTLAASPEAFTPDTAAPWVYPLDSRWTAAQDKVEIEYLADGSPLMVEEIQFATSQEDSASSGVEAGGSAIELLVGAPEQRLWLQHLSEDGTEVVLRVLIAGAEMARLTASDLLGEPADLAAVELRPLRSRVRLVDTSPKAPASFFKARNLEACLEDCEDDYWACGTSQSCQDDFMECASHCGFSGACTPSVNVTVDEDYLGFVSSGSRICGRHANNALFNDWVFWGHKYRVTTTTVETNFQCRQTTEVEVDYEYRFGCYKLFASGCDNTLEVTTTLILVCA